MNATSSTANACNNLVQIITMQMQQAAALATQREGTKDSGGHQFPRVGEHSQTHHSQALQGAAPLANAAMVASQLAEGAGQIAAHAAAAAAAGATPAAAAAVPASTSNDEVKNIPASLLTVLTISIKKHEDEMRKYLRNEEQVKKHRRT